MASMSDQLIEQIARDLDDFHRHLQKDNDELKKSQPILTGFQKAAIAASVAVTGIVAGAGGAAWSTLTGSLQLVSMQIARFFIPSIIAAAEMAQDFAQWLEELSPEARGVLIGFAKVAVAAAGVYLAINVLSNPMVWLAGAVLAAVVALKMLPDIMEWIGEQYRKIRGEGGNRSLGMSLLLGFGGTWLADKLFGDKPHSWDKDRSFGEMFAESMKKNFGFNVPDISKEVEKLLGGLGGGGGIKNRERRPLLMDFVKELQPRFSTVEEARKQFQIGALKSPLEQELMRLQRQMAQEAINEATKRNRAYDVLGNIGNFGFG